MTGEEEEEEEDEEGKREEMEQKDDDDNDDSLAAGNDGGGSDDGAAGNLEEIDGARVFALAATLKDAQTIQADVRIYEPVETLEEVGDGVMRRCCVLIRV